MNKYTVICNLTIFESAEIEAESIEEAIRLATENPYVFVNEFERVGR